MHFYANIYAYIMQRVPQPCEAHLISRSTSKKYVDNDGEWRKRRRTTIIKKKTERG